MRRIARAVTHEIHRALTGTPAEAVAALSGLAGGISPVILNLGGFNQVFFTDVVISQFTVGNFRFSADPGGDPFT